MYPVITFSGSSQLRILINILVHFIEILHLSLLFFMQPNYTYSVV